jgi:queuine tRNA-ribosyltransferase
VFSLAKLRQIDDDGVTFRSHIDGSEHRFTPERAVQIQRNLGSDIMMAFDECPPYPASRDEVAKATERTYRWAVRCRTAWQEQPNQQALFGIIQGGVYDDLRLMSLQQITELDLPGYAIGGVSVGEPVEEMRRVVELVAPRMPADKPRYLMGVGTPDDLLHAVQQGVDMFDCVLPTRLARHHTIFTSAGRINLRNAQYQERDEPIDPTCDCWVCQRYSLAYIHHLFRAGEMLAYRLATYHNLAFYARLMERIRQQIEAGEL